MQSPEPPPSPSETVHDVLIIGGGPAGLSAAVYTSRGKLDTVVLDKNPATGALGYAPLIENYPGVPHRMSGLAMLEQFRIQAQSFGARIVRTRVIAADLARTPREVLTSDELFRAHCVIIATGNMGRKATIAGEEDYLGRGVSYCASCDAPFFLNQPVAVLGRLSDAIDEIESLSRFASTIHLFAPSDKEPVEMPSFGEFSGKIDYRPGWRVAAIRGDSRKVTGIDGTDASGKAFSLDLEGVFVFLHGNRPVVDFLMGQVGLSEQGCISKKHDMSTTIEGVFAAGDVTCKDVRQIAVASGEGCVAGISAEKFINALRRRVS